MLYNNIILSNLYSLTKGQDTVGPSDDGAEILLQSCVPWSSQDPLIVSSILGFALAMVLDLPVQYKFHSLKIKFPGNDINEIQLITCVDSCKHKSSHLAPLNTKKHFKITLGCEMWAKWLNSEQLLLQEISKVPGVSSYDHLLHNAHCHAWELHAEPDKEHHRTKTPNSDVRFAWQIEKLVERNKHAWIVDTLNLCFNWARHWFWFLWATCVLEPR